jgi:hypothetical protein
MNNKNKFLRFLTSGIGRTIITIIVAVIIYPIIIACLNSNSDVILAIVLLVCAVFGWKSLNKITPEIFIWMSFAAWGTYLIVKGLLSIIIGAFVTPFVVGKLVASKATNLIDN